ncbi:MAG: hypothetical protein JJ863_21320 [Deltaproteobacteria bacterium]|nr:hypothetical protein [Deltaproteobacteria bacterium]
MGRKVSDRTALERGTWDWTHLLAVYDEDTASLKVDLALLREMLSRENVEVDSATGARALVEADGGKTIRCTNAGGRAFTVPDGLPEGWFVLIEAAHGAGSVTIAGDGTTVMEGEKGSGTATTFTLATRGKASIGVRAGSPTTSRVDGAVS